MKTSNLISGIFVDPEKDDLGIVDVTGDDIDNYLRGRYCYLTKRKIEYLKELKANLHTHKWEEEHANWIYVPEEPFFEFLFVNFPIEKGWEACYQDLRKMVGPHPIDSVDLNMVETELLKRSLAKGAWKIEEARKAWQERRARRSRPTTQPLNPLTF